MKEKETLLHFIINHLEKELEKVTSHALDSKSSTRGEQIKQESKYDTRAIEAGYLAGALSKRVEEVKIDLNKTKHFLDNLPTPNGQVSLGSIVTLEDESNNFSTYFISPSIGGLVEKKSGIHIISLHSPIAAAAITLPEGSFFEVQSPKRLKEFSIKKVL